MRTAAEDVLKSNPVKSFFGGFGSGAVSGAVMMGIFKLVSVALPMLGLPTVVVPYMIGMVLITGLFTGTMAVMRGDKEARAAAVATGPNMAPVLAQDIGRGPQMNMDVADDMAVPARRDGQSWAAAAGRGSSSQSRIQQIINDGSMSDKDRASAILAARDQASSEATR